MGRKITLTENELNQVVGRWRAFLLAIIEASLGSNSPNFPLIRSITLKAFGDSGLLGDIKRIAKVGEDLDENN